MAIQDLIARVRKRLRTSSGKPANPLFDFDGAALPSSDAEALLAAADNDVAKLIYGHKGHVIHKWLHYAGIYNREFAPWRERNPVFLEIGIFKGGSIEMWRDYFGPDATIAGIDINPECADFVHAPNRAFIGSQADPAFLRDVVGQIGTPDIILDDGSHVATHQMVSFQTMFPLLKVGGLYVIEDLHTSYWPGFYEGGYRRKGTAIELAKTLIDDMHGWYHDRGGQLVDKTSIASVRFYDSLVVIEKGEISAPKHIKIG